MRIILLTVACLGLFLFTLSFEELARIRRYCAVVAQVKTTVIRFYSDERLTHRTYMTSPSMETVLSELDAAANLQRGWRTVYWMGIAMCSSGLAALAFTEWQRRRRPLDELHEREPLRVKLGL